MTSQNREPYLGGPLFYSKSKEEADWQAKTGGEIDHLS